MCHTILLTLHGLPQFSSFYSSIAPFPWVKADIFKVNYVAQGQMSVNAKVKVHFETASLSPDAENTLRAHRVPQTTADTSLPSWEHSVAV